MKRWTPFIKDEREFPEWGRLYSNNRYHVFVREYQLAGPDSPTCVHLSIRNNDRSARHDWRDFQRIKNELVGPEVELVEIYPQESHLVDGANQYHLWGFSSEPDLFTRMGLGFREGRVTWDGISQKPIEKGAENAKQRPNPDYKE